MRPELFKILEEDYNKRIMEANRYLVAYFSKHESTREYSVVVFEDTPDYVIARFYIYDDLLKVIVEVNPDSQWGDITFAIDIVVDSLVELTNRPMQATLDFIGNVVIIEAV